jgi:phospholipid transport system substrate-binding protein
MNMIGIRLSHGSERGRAATRRLSAGRFHLLASAVLVAAALAIPLRSAAAAPDPMTIIKATVGKFVAILSDPALKSNPADRRQRLKDNAAERFDFAEMGRSALGVHWRDLSDQQRKDFVDLFTRFVEAAYVGRLESYSGQQIDFVKASNDGPDYAQVNTNIIQPSADPISLNYRLKLEGDDWKIYDVTVENISIVANYRNQFNRVINNQGFDALMSDMRAKQEGLDTSLAK